MLMNYEDYSSNSIPLRRSFYMKNLSRYADLLLISGTGILLSLNILTLIFYFEELNNQVFEKISPADYDFKASIFELFIGKSLNALDFVYIGIYQISGILACRFKINYILFLVYIQLCKIILSPYVPKNLIIASNGFQIILAMQMFLIIVNFDLKKSRDLQVDHINDFIAEF